MRYRIQHSTVYTYDDDVTDSYGLLHGHLRDLPWQQVVDYQLRLDPEPQTLTRRVDPYGNTQTNFHVSTPHTRLEVTAVTTVDISPLVLDPDALGIGWEAARPGLAHPEAGLPGYENAWSAVDFTLATKKVDIPAAVREYTEVSFAPGRPIGEALVELMHRVHEDFTYKSGSTTLSTTVAQLMERRTGVCQDFSHVMIAGLRSLGLAGRYVSGYLATRPPPGKPRLVGADATHAWVGCWVPGLDWIYLDPTNDKLIDTSHATSGWGRDYDDVTPLKGVIFTEAEESTMKVSVDMAPVDEAGDQLPGSG